MSTINMQSCRCGAKPVIAKTNKGKWRALCPGCQRYYTPDMDTREAAVSAWDKNIAEIINRKKQQKASKPQMEPTTSVAIENEI